MEACCGEICTCLMNLFVVKTVRFDRCRFIGGFLEIVDILYGTNGTDGLDSVLTSRLYGVDPL